jgi:ceramide glucosyltransferase
MDFMVNLPIVEIILGAGLVVSTALYLIGLYSAGEFFRRNAPLADSPHQPVTVLKPLKGLDIGLYENLASLCRQNYASFQLLFGVADPHDPATAVVRRLQREFPGIDMELVIDERVYGANYKVSNLHNMYRRAKHDLIVIADSDIRVGPNYLSKLAAGLQNRRNGIVTCLYRAVNSGGLPTLVESLFIDTDFAALVLLARKVERASYAFGATIAMRREVLDEIGGFLPIANHLADDYQLGYRVAQRGYESALCNEIVETHIAVRNWRQLINHQLRWARTYRIERPAGYFGSIVTHGTFWALLNVLYHQFSPLSCLASLTVLAVRYTSAANFAWRWLRTDISGLQLLLVAPKDLFVSFVWFLAFAGNTVIWSGRRFRVLRSGEMKDLTSPAPATTWDTPLPDLPEQPSRRAAGAAKR